MIRLLGGGGTAAVWLAGDERRDRTVAVKLLHPKLRRSPESLERARREAAVLQRLDHPNIAKAFEADLDDPQPFIVMEVVEGQTLDRLIAGWKSPPSLETIASLFLPLADAVAHAHAAGVIHRDLKPSNIMITDGHVRVLDFGVATLLGQSAHDKTTEGRTVGTFAYMSPEQARGEWVDASADVFALGAILFEVATMQRAFAGDPSSIAEAIARGPRPNLDDVRPDLPAALDDIVKRALAAERASRTESARTLKEEVAQLLEGHTPEDRSKIGTPEGVLVTHRAPRRWLALLALGGSALALGALIDVFLPDPGPPVERIASPERTEVVVPAPRVTQRAVEPKEQDQPGPPEPKPPVRSRPPPPPVKRRVRHAPSPPGALERALGDARASPRDAARLKALATAIDRAAEQVENEKERARIRRLAKVGAMMGSMEGLEQAYRELEASR